jgi:hypothetical protein
MKDVPLTVKHGDWAATLARWQKILQKKITQNIWVTSNFVCYTILSHVFKCRIYYSLAEFIRQQCQHPLLTKGPKFPPQNTKGAEENCVGPNMFLICQKRAGKGPIFF